MKDFFQLFSNELKNIYSAETQVDTLFQELSKWAEHPHLQEALRKHHQEVKQHIQQLEKIGQQLGFSLAGVDSVGMKGLLQEAKILFQQGYHSEVLDTALTTLMQKIEHYEKTSFSVLKAVAGHLQLREIFSLLQELPHEARVKR